MTTTLPAANHYPGLNREQQHLLHGIAANMAALRAAGKLRTNNLTSELGELYAKHTYGLSELPINHKGADLQSQDKTIRYQVKTRRLFPDPHRKSKQTGLIPGLHKPGYDVAIIAVIGAHYELVTLFAVSRTAIDSLLAYKKGKSTSLHVRDLWPKRNDSLLKTIGHFDPAILKKGSTNR